MILINPETVQVIDVSDTSTINVAVKTQNGFFEFPAVLFFDHEKSKINLEELNDFVSFLDTNDIYYKECLSPSGYQYGGLLHWKTWEINPVNFGKFAKEFELNKPYCIVRFFKKNYTPDDFFSGASEFEGVI